LNPQLSHRADPKSKIAVYELVAEAQRQIAQGRCDAALPALKLALAADATLTLAHHQLGACYNELGNKKLAQKEFARAAELNPHMTDAWFDLGLTQIDLREFAEAEASFDKVLRDNPEDREALCYLGVALAGAGRASEASKVLHRVTAADPAFGDGWFQLARLELLAHDYPAALEHFAQAGKTGYDSTQFHAEYGWLLMECNDPVKAARQYTLALKMNPNDPVLHNNIGFALAANGDFPAAIEEYRRALALFPTYTRAQANLDAAIVRQKSFKAATGKR